MAKRPNGRKRIKARKLTLAAEATAFNLAQERETLQRNVYKLTTDHSEHGGKRHGKRMRVAPRDTVYANRFDAVDADGNPVAVNADMIEHRGDVLFVENGATVPVRTTSSSKSLPAGKGRPVVRSGRKYEPTGRIMPTVKSDGAGYSASAGAGAGFDPDGDTKPREGRV